MDAPSARHVVGDQGSHHETEDGDDGDDDARAAIHDGEGATTRAMLTLRASSRTGCPNARPALRSTMAIASSVVPQRTQCPRPALAPADR